LRRALAAATLVAAVAAEPASAHVSISPTLARPGSSQLFVVTLPNDEAGAAITGLTIAVPKEAVLQEAEAVPGWNVRTSRGSVTWSGERIPSGQFASFSLRVALPEREGKLTLEAVERFADGTRLPVRIDVVVAPAAARASGGGSDGLSKVALGIAIAAAALALAGFFTALAVWLRST
jgi:uncharacterized protein YcnI